MNLYLNLGRIFLGLCLVGIGILHFFYPGIRPIILPDATHVPSQLYWTVYLTAILLIGSGSMICLDKKSTVVSLLVAIAFFLLFLLGHLPSFLSAVRADKLKYWTNLNKILALSGGFLVLASFDIKRRELAKVNPLISKLWIPGRYFFAIMLLLFGIGHLLSTAQLSTLVPDYIPFKKFWTFSGGLILVGSAISFFTRFQLERMALLLAATLFIWLLTLHLYYNFRSPNWQEGENFIGSLTCLAFCGISLLIRERSKISRAR